MGKSIHATYLIDILISYKSVFSVSKYNILSFSCGNGGSREILAFSFCNILSSKQEEVFIIYAYNSYLKPH